MTDTTPARPKILVVDRSTNLVERVRAAADRLDPGFEVISGGVADLLADGAYPLLVAGSSMTTGSGLRRLRRMRERSPFTSILLAFVERPEATLRELIQIGADDLLPLTAGDDELASALSRAMRIVERRRATAELAAVDSPAVPRGRVLTIASATGGCGKTFFATNLALTLARGTGARVVLVDLDLQFGEVTTALRLRSQYTISDAVRPDGEERGELADHLDELLLRHSSGFSVLAAPKDPAEADRITGADVTRLLEVLRAQNDYVIIDTPAALSEVALAALDLSDEVVALATPDRPSLHNLKLFLTTAERLQLPIDRFRLVLNKAEPDHEPDLAEIEEQAPQGFSAVIPYDRAVSRSINQGVLLLASDPRSEAARALAAATVPLLPESFRPGVKTPTDRRWSRFLGRRPEAPASTPTEDAIEPVEVEPVVSPEPDPEVLSPEPAIDPSDPVETIDPVDEIDCREPSPRPQPLRPLRTPAAPRGPRPRTRPLVARPDGRPRPPAMRGRRRHTRRRQARGPPAARRR